MSQAHALAQAPHEPDPLADLSGPTRALATALAGGARWKDAAAAAGITTADAYRLYRTSKRLRTAVEALQAQHLPLADKRLDVLDAALELGLAEPRDAKALSVAVSAARQVGDALGIGSAGARVAGAQTVAVSVAVHLDGVLSRAASQGPASPSRADAWTVDAELVDADDP